MRFEQWRGQETDVTAVPVPFPTDQGEEQSISYHPQRSTNVDVLMATAIPAAGVRWNTDRAISTQAGDAILYFI